MLSATPFGAVPDDTAEYMLGDVSVTLVLMESDGSIDASTEDWTGAQIESVKQTVAEGLAWWEETLALEGSVHSLNFILDSTYADSPVPTGYEPISRPWDAYEFWVEDFLDYVGFATQSGLAEDMLSFNHAQRVAHDTDWSFTIFVANSTHDADDRFELGHEFSGAFSFAGGLFSVTPSGRPAKTITHETGHIFYAKDEYPGGGSYFDQRGYYNTQNLNAYDGNPYPELRVDSIMSSGAELQNAYANHLISASAKAMIGWQDSDGDGVFDVLDVPHTLQGTAALDPHTQTYRFLGESSVQTLPNRNPSGLGNDVTIGEISRVEYRFDGGDWQTIGEYHTPTAELDLAIPVAENHQDIEIRTIDQQSGITSNVFHGAVGRAESIQMPGINGFAWVDVDGDGLREVGEPGLKHWTVTLAQPDGTPLPSARVVEPDDFSDGTVIDTATAGATLSVETIGGFSSSVGVASSPVASTGNKVLAFQVGSAWSTLWTPDTRRLRIDFTAPVSHVQIDAVGDTDGDFGRLEVFDQNDQLLARYTSAVLDAGQFETLEATRPTADIAYALVGGQMGSQLQLDNLRFGVDPKTDTDDLGAFTFAGLDSGTYLVELGLRQGWTNVSPQAGKTTVVVGAGEVESGVDFGVSAISAGSLWQNPTNKLDVTDDGVIAPNDLLWIANRLYFEGSRQLPAPTVPPNAPAPYLDVNGDGYTSPADALLVAHFLRSSGNGASGEPWPDAAANSGVGDDHLQSAAGKGNDGTSSASTPASQPPAVVAEGLAESPASSDRRAVVWAMEQSVARSEPASGAALPTADRLARRGSEPPATHAEPSRWATVRDVALLREVEQGPFAASPESDDTKDATLSTDSLFSDGSWLERFLSKSSSERPLATPIGAPLDRAADTS